MEGGARVELQRWREGLEWSYSTEVEGGARVELHRWREELEWSYRGGGRG